MSDTKIKNCTCKHEYQDKIYGKRKRVHNQCDKGWKFTVCEDKKLD